MMKKTKRNWAKEREKLERILDMLQEKRPEPGQIELLSKEEFDAAYDAISFKISALRTVEEFEANAMQKPLKA